MSMSCVHGPPLTPGLGAERPVFGQTSKPKLSFGFGFTIHQHQCTRGESEAMGLRPPDRDRTEPDKPRASLHMSKVFRGTHALLPYAYRARALELDAIAIAIACWRCSRRSPRVCGSCTEFGATGLRG